MASALSGTSIYSQYFPLIGYAVSESAADAKRYSRFGCTSIALTSAVWPFTSRVGTAGSKVPSGLATSLIL